MYKVLVADDNALIRKSIIKRVPWKLLDMECVGEAENGKETADLILQMRPDIVITDIKMPVADGFFAIEKTRSLFPDIQFIIISGYDDFAYLKQSIQLQVLNYILKPIDTEELISSLKKAAERCSESRADSASRQLYDRHQIQNTFFRFLSGETGFHTFAGQLAELDYPLVNSLYQVICLNWVSGKQQEILLEEGWLERQELLLEELFPMSTCRILPMNENTCLLLMSHTAGFHFSSSLQQKLYDHCFQNGPEDTVLWMACCGITDLQQLPGAYREGLRLLLRRFTDPGQGSCILSAKGAGSFPEFPFSSLEKELSLALELRMYEECKRLVRSVVSRASASWEIFCAGMPHFLDFLDLHLSRLVGRPVLPEKKRELYLLRYADCRQIEEQLCELVGQIPQDAAADTSEQIIAYIQGNYRSALTLQQLSELFHVNPVYLGQLIKKQTGKAFNGLLNELRLTEARRLIRQEPDISLANLAFSLGYTDPHYFTKVFKRYYGITPSELKHASEKQL